MLDFPVCERLLVLASEIRTMCDRLRAQRGQLRAAYLSSSGQPNDLPRNARDAAFLMQLRLQLDTEAGFTVALGKDQAAKRFSTASL
jgi:hypothetical protein